MRVSGVLLAAGASTRFGSPKMLAPVGENGEPLLQKISETWLRAGLDELLIVLGCGSAHIRTTLEENLLRRVDRDESSATSVRFVESPTWEAGMFSSVKAGLAAASPASTHIAISPADLPFLTESSLRRLLEAVRPPEAGGPATVLVPVCRRRRGHPLLVPAALRTRLLSWPDSARLNQLFEEPDVTVQHLEGFDETILRDVDRPDDLVEGLRRPRAPSF